MKNTDFHLNFNLFFDGLGLQRQYTNRSEPMELSSLMGKGRVQRYVPRHDMNIVVSEMTFQREVDVSLKTGMPMIELHYCSQGTRQFSADGEEYHFAPGMISLQLIRETKVRFEFEEEQPYQMLGIGIPVSTFHHFLEGADGSRPVDFNKLLGQRNYRVFQERVDPASSMTIKRLMQTHQQKGISNLELECSVLELLSSSFQSLLIERKTSNLSNSDIDKIKRAREIILEWMADPPTLIELSRMIGLNDYKLKVGFKEIYGTTVFGYLREKRLEKALLLLQEGNMNVYETSLAVGYSNPSHFAQAFRDKYGVTPGSLTRRSSIHPPNSLS